MSILRRMLITMIKARLKEVAKSDPYPEANCGHLGVMSDLDEIRKDYFKDASSNALIVSYNYWLEEVDECNEKEWLKWYENELFGKISQVMQDLGYEEIDEIDGSGGGLYYGVILYQR